MPAPAAIRRAPGLAAYARKRAALVPLIKPKVGQHLPDGFLRHVVAVWARYGMATVIEQTGVSERTARRWLAEAERRRLLDSEG